MSTYIFCGCCDDSWAAYICAARALLIQFSLPYDREFILFCSHKCWSIIWFCVCVFFFCLFVCSERYIKSKVKKENVRIYSIRITTAKMSWHTVNFKEVPFMLSSHYYHTHKLDWAEWNYSFELSKITT